MVLIQIFIFIDIMILEYFYSYKLYLGNYKFFTHIIII